MGVFYEAPHWTHEDFYAFLLLQRIYGNYSIEMLNESLGEVEKQHNTLHEFVKQVPDLERYDCVYSPYSDCGIFGHYFCGSPEYSNHMSYIGGVIGEIMSNKLSDEEVNRAKHKLYHELLSVQAISDIMQQYGPQYIYLNRKVPRSEIAGRISLMDTDYLRGICKKWFVDKQPSYTNWGPSG